MLLTTNPETNWIINYALKDQTQKLTGDNLILAEIFELICKQNNIQSNLLLLCAENGLIISSNPVNSKNDLRENIIDFDKLINCPYEIFSTNSDLGYKIITSYHANTNSILQDIVKTMDITMNVINNTQKHNRYILQCFDQLDIAFSVYDVEGHLLYTNKVLCELFNIEDRNKILGMHINDIMNICGITISPLNKNIDSLKMFEVLKTGNEEIGWEIIMQSHVHKNLIRMAENDILPIHDKNGEIIGVIDIIRSYNRDFRHSNKFTALSANYTFNDIIHVSKTMQDKISLAKKMSKNNSPILIVGESGVGKELFAQSIHNYSNRKDKPFVALNCASFPSELITSELFGYEAGAFTDASKKGHIGKFELANGGTLFLDEISELPYDSQSKLLRILETQVITKIGGTREIPIDVRVISASNKDLKQMVSAGLFREDLYYRIQTLQLQIPPLRQRYLDIPPLCRYFLSQCALQNSCVPKKMRADAISVLQNYEWPGNIRELKNIMTSITILSKEKTITAKTINEYLHPYENSNINSNNTSPEEHIEQIKKKISASYAKLLNEALILCDGNKNRAAEMIGVSRRTFYRMLEKYCS